MKILILQLARFGDILMTGPVMKALRRQYPHAQIDILVRSKFHEAALHLEGHNNIHLLPTANLLSPILAEEMNEVETFHRVHGFVNDLRQHNYTDIINLSFSPVSSWLTKMLTTETTQVKGYSRYSDGSFKICDEASEYFYAQVGVGQHNRFHLINMMATVAGVDITAEDLVLSTMPQTRLAIPPQAIAIHIGASQEGKRIPTLKWTSFIREFSEISPDMPIVLLGSENEYADAEKIAASSAHAQLFNFVGKTKWADVIGILAKSRMLVAGDSSLIQAANLSGTACFNISNPTVNFWETGPRTDGSFVYFEADFEMLNTKDVANKVSEILAGWSPETLHRSMSTLPAFEGPATGTEFQWSLIGALYWGADFPRVSDQEAIAIKHMAELNDVVIENLQRAEKMDADILSQILRRADEIQSVLARQFPDLQPLFRFLDVERIRIGPGIREEIIQSMLVCHERCGLTLKTLLAFQEAAVEMVDGQL